MPRHALRPLALVTTPLLASPPPSHLEAPARRRPTSRARPAVARGRRQPRWALARLPRTRGAAAAVRDHATDAAARGDAHRPVRECAFSDWLFDGARAASARGRPAGEPAGSGGWQGPNGRAGRRRPTGWRTACARTGDSCSTSLRSTTRGARTSPRTGSRRSCRECTGAPRRALLCHVVPDERGEGPTAESAPLAPAVRETSGAPSPLRSTRTCSRAKRTRGSGSTTPRASCTSSTWRAPCTVCSAAGSTRARRSLRTGATCSSSACGGRIRT